MHHVAEIWFTPDMALEVFLCYFTLLIALPAHLSEIKPRHMTWPGTSTPLVWQSTDN